MKLSPQIWLKRNTIPSQKKMIAEFKNGIRYEYDDVPHQLSTSFRSAESQGNFFNKNISKNHTYRKL